VYLTSRGINRVIGKKARKAEGLLAMIPEGNVGVRD